MVVSHYRISSTFLYWEGTFKIWHFMCILRVNLGGKYLGEIHEWQKDAWRSSYHRLNTSKEGVGIPHEQWILMSLLVNSIVFSILTERVLKIRYFVCTLWVNRGGKSHGETHEWLADTVNSLTLLPSMSKAGFEIVHMLWISLLTAQHTIFHAESERIPNTCILLVIWESTFVEHSLVRPTCVSKRCTIKLLPSV